jgi:hypothetical protein
MILVVGITNFHSILFSATTNPPPQSPPVQRNPVNSCSLRPTPMQLLLDIRDDKVSFVLELLSNLPFVKTKKVTPPNVVAEPQEEYRPRTEEEILEGLREALHEVKLHKEGKIKLRPLKDVLDEL